MGETCIIQDEVKSQTERSLALENIFICYSSRKNRLSEI